MTAVISWKSLALKPQQVGVSLGGRLKAEAGARLGSPAPTCTMSNLESHCTPAKEKKSSFPLVCGSYTRAHAGCFPLKGIVFLAAAIPCLIALCSFSGSCLIRSLNSLLYPLCQNEWKLWKWVWYSLGRKRSCSKGAALLKGISQANSLHEQFLAGTFVSIPCT